MNTKTRTKSRDYTPQEVDLALTALILNGCNYKRTSRELNNQPSHETLRRWREEYAARYAELQKDLAPKLADKLAAEGEALIVRYIEAQKDALAKTVEGMDGLDADKAAGVARNLATAAALNNDKIVSPLRLRPTSVHVDRTGSELLRSLARTIGYDADATAVELEPAKELDP